MKKRVASSRGRPENEVRNRGGIGRPIAREPAGVDARNVEERVRDANAVGERRNNDEREPQSAGLITC